MKKLPLLIVGLLISFAIFYFFANNGGFISKIIFAIVAVLSWLIFLFELTSSLQEKSYYKELSKFTFIGSIILAILSYETFQQLVFGGTASEQHGMLTKSSSLAIGKITEIEHYDGFSIKRKDMPEHWEIKYIFQDSTKNENKGIFNTNTENISKYKVGDILRIKYLGENPAVNEPIHK
jgi:hypothetical protein